MNEDDVPSKDDAEPGEPRRGAVPDAIRLAWRLSSSERAVPPRGLNLHKVIEAAIAIADDEGLDGLSFRKLGRKLGFTTMAVYRHVRSRDDLLLLMGDAALGTPPSAIVEAETWQAGLRLWGQVLLRRYVRHHWLLDIPALGLPVTPNHILWVEYFLNVMASGTLNLTLQQQLDAALLIDGHARYIALLYRLGMAHPTDEPAESPASWLRSLIDARSHPFFSAVLDSGVLEDETGPGFDFGLDCIIAGLSAQAGSAPASS